jgi:hypothetical protein
MALAADAAQAMGGPAGELPEVTGAQVGQFMLFPITPEILHRVEFGGVRRETFHPDFAVESGDVLADELAAMDAGPVPDDEQLAGDMALQMAQKLDDPLAGDGSLVEPEVKVPPGQSSDGRELVPVEVELQHGGLPFWTPGAHPVGLLAQSAFVDEDEGAPFRFGIFLIQGHFTRFQWVISASLRSRARPVGR